MKAWEALVIALVAVLAAVVAWNVVDREEDRFGLVGIGLFLFVWAIGVTAFLNV